MRDNKIKDRQTGEGKNELLKNKSKSESESGRQTEWVTIWIGGYKTVEVI